MKENPTEKTLAHFERMLSLGNQVLATRRSPPSGVLAADFVDSTLANQWFVSSLSLLQRTIGKDSVHYAAMDRLYKEHLGWPEAQRAFGVLQAAYEDTKHGALFSTTVIVTAEIFDDLLEQANSLLNANYYAPAAVVIGCVLENTLKKLCLQNAIEISDKAKLDAMNTSLAKAGIYNLLTQKKITALADIRNSAAHGKWDQFDANDVKDMLKWVGSFIEKELS